ncbi:MAG TPA: hypothetical protein VL484_06265 [Vicinamibacterales bacterium]|jgi:hypothetical protein|nr:hypothetical protein [Vicinamibacterales bacterium]
MTKVVWGAKVASILVLAFAATSCGTQTREGTSSSYLVINSLQGSPGQAGSFGNVLESDVVNVDPTTHAQSIAADQGQVTLALALKDPGSSTNPNTPTPNNYVTVTQYHVDYVRSDGRNVQGVDVPYSFDGAVTNTVQGTSTFSFTLVRIQAKQEAPLQALAGGGSSIAISTIARVTFYGHDQTGREVSVTGNIEVDFADWAG